MENSPSVLVIGMGGVGKQRLVYRCLTNRFIDDGYLVSLEDQWGHCIQINGQTINTKIMLALNSNEYEMIDLNMYSRANCFIFVFSVDIYGSFKEYNSFLERIKKYKQEKKYRIVAFANKTDLNDGHWNIERNEYLSFFRARGITVFETSALKGDCVNDGFCYALTESYNLLRRESEKAKRPKPKDMCLIQ